MLGEQEIKKITEGERSIFGICAFLNLLLRHWNRTLIDLQKVFSEINQRTMGF